MGRKYAKKAQSADEKCREEPLDRPTEGVSAPAVTWEQLLGYAELDLDERGEESWEKCKVSAEKKFRRARERGLAVEFPVDGVRAALVDYYGIMVCGAEGPRGISAICARHGVTTDALFVGQAYYPELRLVYDYVRNMGVKVAKARAVDIGIAAQASQERLVTEDGCELNQKAVELSLKATMRDVYGDGEKDGGASDAKKGISYNFPNMTVNWIVAPAELAKRVEAKPEPEAIDV